MVRPFPSSGQIVGLFRSMRPASATRIGRDRVPDSGWNHFGLSPGPWVASESGFDLFDLPPRPLERTTLVDGADHVLAASRACVCAHGCAAPGYASSKSPDSRAPSEAGGLTTCRGRKSCLHSGSRPKWPAWRIVA